MSEVLKNLSVVIGYCNSHGVLSFLDQVFGWLLWREPAISARNQKPLAVDKNVSDLFPRAVVDGGDGRARYVHTRGALLLRQRFVIEQTECFKLVNGHQYALGRVNIVGRKAAIHRQPVNKTATLRSRHSVHFLSQIILSRLLTYVNNSI